MHIFFKNKITFLPLFAVTTTVSLMGFGCNPLAGVQEQVEKKVGEKVTESAVGALTGGKVKMDTDNNNWQYKDNKTGNSVAIGEDLKLPEDFPKDVPVYTKAKIKSVSIGRTGDKEVAITLGADEAGPSVIAEWYSDTLKKSGWSEDSSTAMGKSEARNYKKGTAQISLLAFPVDEQAKGSLVTLVYKPGNTETNAEVENNNNQ
ncbi:hypothetical protein IT408_00320 [Candidatus Uhrbacteria bacterium]|nr:hypothetical protein [Candidatus Uhrbacteria bacterium]